MSVHPAYQAILDKYLHPEQDKFYRQWQQLKAMAAQAKILHGANAKLLVDGKEIKGFDELYCYNCGQVATACLCSAVAKLHEAQPAPLPAPPPAPETPEERIMKAIDTSRSMPAGARCYFCDKMAVVAYLRSMGVPICEGCARSHLV